MPMTPSASPVPRQHAARLWALRAGCGAILLALGTALQAQTVFQQPMPAAPVNTVALGANNVGLKACRPALERLSALAMNGSRNNDVLLDWDRKRPATSPVFALMGLEFPGSGAAMSIVTVPEANGACSVVGERISAAPVPCQTVASQELGGYRATRLLSNFTVYQDARDPTSTVSLVDTPPGCLVIRRYTEFNWKPAAASTR